MTARKLFLSLAMALLVFAFCAEAHAQKRRSGPVRGPFRILGLGWNSGNHWRTPGHNTDYYSPYSLQNTQMMSAEESAVPMSNPTMTPPDDAPNFPPTGGRHDRLDQDSGANLGERIQSVYQWPEYESNRIQNSNRKTPSFNSNRGGGAFSPRRFKGTSFSSPKQ